MKKRNVIIIVLSILIVLVLGIVIYNVKNRVKPENLLNTYISLLNEGKYEEMYEMISSDSKEKISKEDFIKRNKNIYEGIDACNIKINVLDIQKNDGIYEIEYNESLNSVAGNINFRNTSKFSKENKKYLLKWSSSQIFPYLRDKDKIRVSTVKANRGEILDRNNIKLAKNGKLSLVGLVPGKLGNEKEANIKKVANLLEISEEFILEKLNKGYVKEDTFVDLKKVSMSDTKLKEELLKIPGVMINSVDGRVYPFGKELSHLIGYIKPISMEELNNKEKEGYTSKSYIGKSGIEYSFENELRGIDGVEINILDENGNKIREIAKQDKKDGKDIKLTIDSKLQTNVYNQMKDDKGLFVVMNPKTGELLSLVSAPTYDANDFILGLTNSKWDELNNDEKKPLFNRFLQSYCPGSTFKPITGGIGLSNNIIKKDTTFEYSGNSWQKDKSWGDYKVTTLKSYLGPKNVTNALINSDNIFFANTALKIGKDKFKSSLEDLYFNKDMDIMLNTKKSQIGDLKSEIKLADTGYGQGDLLVNPIHMASIYSIFYNEGKMVKPKILYNDNNKIEYLNENAISKEAANIIKEGLIEVIENKDGTAKDMKIDGIKIAGKTGTAELKKTSDDKESGTLGWFNCFTINKENEDYLIIGMVENTQNNSSGGSHLVIKKIKEGIFIK